MQKAAANGLYQSTATARSIAFTFFKNKLHESIRNDKTKTVLSEVNIAEPQYTIHPSDVEPTTQMLECLEKIKPTLSAEDIAICDWKFTDKLSNSEIAERLKITTNSFTNRFYRLTIRMQKLINDCLKSLTP